MEVATTCAINAVLRGKHLSVNYLRPPKTRALPPAAAAATGAEERWTGARKEPGVECVFETALLLMLRQHEAFPHPVTNIWAGGVMVLLHEWMVNRGELAAAEG